ncbi:pentapeptide repeat-containing protein [Sphaerisporangium flaviroseum]|uniref:pentapeptide repeat-containing protein n=1 Tax=Sphaerisporangium flaviroseum TaxID=509199 RepID=UPI003CD0A4C2
MTSTDLSGSTLSGDLRNADPEKARLENADLSFAHLRGADLSSIVDMVKQEVRRVPVSIQRPGSDHPSAAVWADVVSRAPTSTSGS